ncbi:MAG: hypothetical protein COW08_02565 [Ignavibacteriales bacterium CG12_big_fil_rev_8_21_14_0_65_30_8]|nr:MAG: hypothetical protein COW08_02565 [Ignavibacteriales bacterium CG12_big_fil_rev_8_21_14_0_65_30_8]
MKNVTESYKSNFNLILLLILILQGFIFSQTNKHPILISISHINNSIKPLEKSALEIKFKIPQGYWLGSSDPSARNPAATLIEVEPLEHFNFEEPIYPKAVTEGVPVHKGYTQIYKEEISVIIPFTTDKEVKNGSYEVSVRITYTPGLNAGQLVTHINEKYSTNVVIDKNSEFLQAKIPQPFTGKVPSDFLVKEEITVLDEPLNSILYRWKEGTAIPNFLHWIWLDPDNHGKHIQTAWNPFLGNTENNGFTYGGSVALFNLTPEGIMTGLFQLRVLHNEILKTNFAIELVSCPAAYHNYWLSAEISTNGESKQIHFHKENLTLGKNDRFGYELQLDVFKDPRFRFYGLGASTRDIDRTDYAQSETGAVLDFYWMPADHIRIGVGGKVRSVAVNDGAENRRGKDVFTTSEVNTGGKFANVPGIKGATVYGERISFIYDGRNSEFMPTSGFYAKVTAEYNQITDQVVTNPNTISNYGRFLADFRKYFSTIDQKYTLLFRNTWLINTSKYVPFFEQGNIGGDFSNRGFDKGRFYGQNSVFASMEFRYQAFTMNVMGSPMTIELAPFVDMGQVFDSDGFNGRFNINPGIGMRIINKPNVGIVTAMAYGQDGITLTGGVQLPF